MNEHHGIGALKHNMCTYASMLTEPNYSLYRCPIFHIISSPPEVDGVLTEIDVSLIFWNPTGVACTVELDPEMGMGFQTYSRPHYFIMTVT